MKYIFCVFFGFFSSSAWAFSLLDFVPRFMFLNLQPPSIKAKSLQSPPHSRPQGFKQIIQKYQEDRGLKMSFEKETALALLKKVRLSRGRVFLSGRRIALEIEDSLNTRIVFDGKSLWYIVSPPGEKKQMVRMKEGADSQNRALLSILFRPDVFFQQFRFLSSRPKGRTWILDFAPANSESEIKSFSVKTDGKRILKLWTLWSSTGNKETYTFSNIRFHQSISPRRFQVKGKTSDIGKNAPHKN